MAQKINPEELISFEELLVSNTIQIDAVTQLFIEKGFSPKRNFLKS